MLLTKLEIEPYVPHSGFMLLLDRVLECGIEHIVTEIDVSDTLPCCVENYVPAYLGLEIMAQSIAIWSGLQRNNPGVTQPIGFLLGSRKYQCSVKQFIVGETLKVYATRIVQNEGLASFECVLERSGAGELNSQLAKANVNVFSVDKETQSVDE